MQKGKKVSAAKASAPKPTSSVEKKRPSPPPKPTSRASAAKSAPGENRARKFFPIVGIGASAGGLEAFTRLLKQLPPDTGLAFVLVQHLDPEHESALTQILARATAMPVSEVTNNLGVEPNHVYVIPPNSHLTIQQGVLKLGPRPDGHKPHRSIDGFFESLAQDQHERAMGVILSGTATDGTLGLEAIKTEGGITFAQDDSAKYDSMPRSALASGCVDFVLKPEDIAKELARIAKHPFVAGKSDSLPEEDRATATAHEDDKTPLPSGGSKTPSTGARRARAEAARAPSRKGERGYEKILLLLRNHSGVDFSLYKSSTIQRRITRRIVLNKKESLEEYASFLRGNSKELDALYSDVLISVTSFFRNPEAFELLERKIFPKLLQHRSDFPLRVWVLGCSTGQEAYSMAMAFSEAAEKTSRTRQIQIFATDLNDTLLDKARAGLYAKSLALDIAPARLRRFFIEEDEGYRVVKSLRDMVVFARQNLIADPPFSRMDLVSCRNVLIYLEPTLQQKALVTFHYALKPEGYLFLGGSESVGSFTDLFELIDRKHKIYAKKAAPTPAFHLPEKNRLARRVGLAPPRRARILPRAGGHPGGATESVFNELSAQREADRITVNQFALPAVLINAALQILQFRGPTSAYLEPPSGKASFDVLKMAREGLMLPLRAAIRQAKKDNKSVRTLNVRVKQDGHTRTINLEVIPLKNLRERCFLIFFEDSKAKHSLPAARGEKRSKPGKPGILFTKRQEGRRIKELDHELAETRDFLQSIQEQHEAAAEELQASNEEVQSSNEEVQSSNEELQSVNEELETSKEELESANEELTTVNEELSHRNAELNRLNNDLINFQNSAQLAIVVLGRDLTVRRFTTQAEKQFNLRVSDLNRPINHVRHNLFFPSQTETPAAGADLEHLVAAVIDSAKESECDVRDKAGRWYSLRVRPYLTLDNKVDGAVLVLVDIDALKRNERIQAALDFAQSTVDTVREQLLVLDGELRVRSAGRTFYETFRTTPEQTLGQFIYDLGDRQWNIPRLRKLLEEILSRNASFEDFEVEHDFKELGRRTMLLNASRLDDVSSGSQWILLAIDDITDRKQHLQELQSAHLAEAIMATARDPLLILEADLRVHMANEAFYRTFKVTPAECQGQTISELGNGQWRIPRLLELLQGILSRNTSFDNFAVTHDFVGIGNRTMLLHGRKLAGDYHPQRILLGIQDITEVLQFQAAARRSAALTDAILKAALDAIITMDHEGKLVEFNPAAEKLFGFSRDEVLGKELATLMIPERLRPRHAQGLAHYLATGEGPMLNRQIEMPVLRADGTEFSAEFAIVAIPGAQPPLFTCFLKDITERKRSEAALSLVRKRYASLVMTFTSVVWNTDPEGRFIDPQPQWQEHTGQQWEKYRGFGWADALHPDDRQSVKELWLQALKSRSLYRASGRLWSAASQDYRFFEAQAVPLLNEDGSVLEWIGCVTDVHERKRAEQKLSQAQAQLADRAGQLEHAVAERTARLQETLSELESFSYSIAHDLRAPLRSMQSFAQILADDCAAQVGPLGMDYVGRIVTSADRMDKLIQDVLTYSRVAVTELKLERVDLQKLLQGILESYPTFQAPQTEIQVEWPLPAVWGNAAALTQCLSNLLGNAIKFVAPGITPSVRVWSETVGERVRLFVQDNGIGIDKDSHEKIFGIFQRNSKIYEGTGIGLAIVKKAVQRMHGSVHLKSEPGQGSTFWLELSRADQQGDRGE